MNWRPEGWQKGKDKWYRHSAHSQILDGSVYEAGADAMLEELCEEIEKARKANPYPKAKLASAEYYEGEGFDRACRKILSLLRSEK